MRLNNATDIGLCIRSERRRLGLTQAQLCTAAQVSRRWLSDLEAGKPSAEVGRVVRVMHALDLRLDASRAELRPDELDLDDVLARYTHRGIADGHDA